MYYNIIAGFICYSILEVGYVKGESYNFTLPRDKLFDILSLTNHCNEDIIGKNEFKFTFAVNENKFNDVACNSRGFLSKIHWLQPSISAKRTAYVVTYNAVQDGAAAPAGVLYDRECSADACEISKAETQSKDEEDNFIAIIVAAIIISVLLLTGIGYLVAYNIKTLKQSDTYRVSNDTEGQSQRRDDMCLANTQRRTMVPL